VSTTSRSSSNSNYRSRQRSGPIYPKPTIPMFTDTCPALEPMHPSCTPPPQAPRPSPTHAFRPLHPPTSHTSTHSPHHPLPVQTARTITPQRQTPTPSQPQQPVKVK
jgi:hypothetical protein